MAVSVRAPPVSVFGLIVARLPRPANYKALIHLYRSPRLIMGILQRSFIRPQQLATTFDKEGVGTSLVAVGPSDAI